MVTTFLLMVMLLKSARKKILQTFPGKSSLLMLLLNQQDSLLIMKPQTHMLLPAQRVMHQSEAPCSLVLMRVRSAVSPLHRTHPVRPMPHHQLSPFLRSQSASKRRSLILSMHTPRLRRLLMAPQKKTSALVVLPHKILSHHPLVQQLLSHKYTLSLPASSMVSPCVSPSSPALSSTSPS